MTGPWDGLRLVVTGGGSGIGAAVVMRAAGMGADVLAVGRRLDRLSRTADQAHGPGSGRVVPFVADIAEPAAAATVAAAAGERLGGVYALVNNAGHARFDSLEAADPEDLQQMLGTNVVGPAALIQALLPQLRASRGCVVNVSSVGGALAMPGRSFYGASKAALNSLTRSLAVELAPEVRVNAVLPGPVDTQMWGDAAGDDTQALRERVIGGTPMARFGEPDEVAAWVCHLIDPATAGWITGSLVSVDGGRTA